MWTAKEKENKHDIQLFNEKQIHTLYLSYMSFFFGDDGSSRQMTYSKHFYLLYSRSLIGMNTGTYVNTYRMLTPYL